MNPRVAAAIGSVVVATTAGMAAGYEGLVMRPYNDVVGVRTVCFGHTGNVQERPYSRAECEALLRKDMGQAWDIVNKCQPGLPFGPAVAFTDAVFNMGPTIACSTTGSTAAQLLRAKRYEEACRQLPRWSKARVAGNMVELRGLKLRREHFMNFCLKELA